MKKKLLALGLTSIFIPFTYGNIPRPRCLPEAVEKITSYQEIEKEIIGYSKNFTRMEHQIIDFLFPTNINNIWVKRTEDTIELVTIEILSANDDSVLDNTTQSNQAKLTFYKFKWQKEPILNNNSSDRFKVFISQWYQKREPLYRNCLYPIPSLHIRFLYPVNKPQTNKFIWGVEFNKAPMFCLWVTSKPGEIHDFEFVINLGEVIAIKAKKSKITTIYDKPKIQSEQTNDRDSLYELQRKQLLGL